MVLWSEAFIKYARLHLYKDEKAFHQQKSLRQTILIDDVAAACKGKTDQDQGRISLQAPSLRDKDFSIGRVIGVNTPRSDLDSGKVDKFVLLMQIL